jgi:hypothetical protein
MPYIVTTSSGSALTTIPDNTVNSTTTSITLVGKNYTGYGAFLNENYIKILENFNNTTAPTAPLQGQLWYDNSNSVLKVYAGALAGGWKSLQRTSAGSSAPSGDKVTGDLWWDTASVLLKVWGGSSWISIGPDSNILKTTIGASTSGVIVDTIVDTLSVSHSVLRINIANNTIAIVSKDSASFQPGTAIPGFSLIYPGINLISSNTLTGSQYTSSQIRVGATSTMTVSDASGEVKFVNNNANVDMGFYVSKSNVSTKAIGITGSTGAVTFTGTTTFGATATFQSQILPSVNNTLEIGSSSNKFANVWGTTFRGTAVTASYADLAERFEADEIYSPGTVVSLGGAKEITAAVVDLCDNVFGVISTKAAFLMNGEAGTDETHPPVAVNGRVPVRVIGQIRKGDRLVSAGNGLARAAKKTEITAFNVIGRSLENKYTDDSGTVEAIVRLNN